MKKILFYFLISLNYYKALKAQCYNDSFGIYSSSIVLTSDSFNLSYGIYSKIQNYTEYADRCLEYVEITTLTQYNETYYRNYLKSEDMNKTFNFSLDTKPLTNYSVSLIYKVVNITNNFFLLGGNWSSCFGNPDAPNDLKVHQQNKILFLEWEKPVVTNSPGICYYKVIRQFLGQSEIEEFKTTQTAFNFSGEDLKKDFQVDIYAYNDVECYIEDYPVASYCSIIGQNLTRSTSLRYFYKSETDTTTKIKIPTTSTENKAIKNFNSTNLFFFIIINGFLFFNK